MGYFSANFTHGASWFRCTLTADLYAHIYMQTYLRGACKADPFAYAEMPAGRTSAASFVMVICASQLHRMRFTTSLNAPLWTTSEGRFMLWTIIYLDCHAFAATIEWFGLIMSLSWCLIKYITTGMLYSIQSSPCIERIYHAAFIITIGLKIILFYSRCAIFSSNNITYSLEALVELLR